MSVFLPSPSLPPSLSLSRFFFHLGVPQVGRRASDGAVLISPRKALPTPPPDPLPTIVAPRPQLPQPVERARAGSHGPRPDSEPPKSSAQNTSTVTNARAATESPSTDKDALWDALVNKVQKKGFHVGELVWSRAPDGQWLRGELVGQVDRGE